MRRRGPWLLAVLAFAVAVLAYAGRRATIRAFFTDGAGEVFLPPAHLGVGLSSAERVRVVVFDGLSRATADTLPNLATLCDGGLELEVDNGFPTVSLPVQHVLWTGLTQQQSGLWYRIPRLQTPPPGSLAARVPGSVAVAESHPDIVNSFGFSQSEPAPGAEWSEAEFLAAAESAVSSEAPLVLVHVLRIDEMGHALGADSAAYTEAAQWADARLAAWIAQAPVGTRWFVLSDHGHLPRGGHGGEEPEIRLVRACIAGDLPDGLPGRGQLHLIDFSRALADSLGVVPSADAGGRPLTAALEHPDIGATLPTPSALRWSLAGLVLAGALAFARWTSGRGWMWVPWWIVIAYAGVTALAGPPTLSNPAIYPPWGRDILLAGLPGFLILAATTSWVARTRPLWRIAVAQLVPGMGLAVGLGILCGVPQLWLGLTTAPPLMPLWTAHTSVALSFCLGGGVALGIVGVAVAATRRS